MKRALLTVILTCSSISLMAQDYFESTELFVATTTFNFCTNKIENSDCIDKIADYVAARYMLNHKDHYNKLIVDGYNKVKNDYPNQSANEVTTNIRYLYFKEVRDYWLANGDLPYLED